MNHKPSKILVFDTAMSACSAAIYDVQNNQVLISKTEPMQRGQAERLVPMINEVITESGFTYADVDLIACTHGPGAFTGLRLSLATAKALSLSLNKPAIGLSTLEVIAATDTEQTYTYKLVCLETKRKDYYIQIFNKEGAALTSPLSAKLPQVQNIIIQYNPIILGDANARLKQELALNIDMNDILYPSCEALSAMALKNFNQDGERLQSMSPCYLRDADVSFPATKK